MNIHEIQYCLAKQLTTAHAVETNYGAIPLDCEMKAAIDKALRPILEKRVQDKLGPGRPVKPHRSGGGHWVGG